MKEEDYHRGLCHRHRDGGRLTHASVTHSPPAQPSSSSSSLPLLLVSIVPQETRGPVNTGASQSAGECVLDFIFTDSTV